MHFQAEQLVDSLGCLQSHHRRIVAVAGERPVKRQRLAPLGRALFPSRREDHFARTSQIIADGASRSATVLRAKLLLQISEGQELGNQAVNELDAFGMFVSGAPRNRLEPRFRLPFACHAYCSPRPLQSQIQAVGANSNSVQGCIAARFLLDFRCGALSK